MKDKQHACCKSGQHKHAEEDACCKSEQLHKEQSKEHSGCVGCAAPVSSGRLKSFIILGISLAALIVSFISPFHEHSVLKWFDFGWIAVILCGVPVFMAAIAALKKGKITSSLLISVSILACITLEFLTLSGVLPTDGHAHSNIFAAGEVAWLMAVGGLIEDFTIGKARAGIEKLMALAPSVAKYRVGDSIIEKPLSEVMLGDAVTVLVGDIISVDGEIISGTTAVDESILTGESVPVDKIIGDKVFGGTLNISGALEVRVTRRAEEMAVNKLKDLVSEAEGKKAPISKVADKWAGIIVPAAMGLSVVVFLVSYFWLAQGNLAESILRAVTMLVVFCPCALALATPTAIAAGLGAGARRGILIKSGGALEALARVKTVALDKTGTLTKGQLVVDEVFAVDGNTRHLEAIAGGCERLSEHPIAKAIVSHCIKGGELPECVGTKSLVGSGVEGEINGKKVSVVKWKTVLDNGLENAAVSAKAEQLLSGGKTLAAVIEEGKLLGIIALSDQIKPDSAEAVAQLKSIGIRAVMLTGDNAGAAAALSEKIGIDYLAGLLPEDKLTEIERLKKSGLVCMVGDGVNDAPALAAADCSIAMAALGSDTAIETADVALMTGDVKKVSWLCKFSRKVLTTIKLNIIISLMISFASVILSALGLLNPITGALVHNISSVLVVTNSAFLLVRGRQSKKELL